MKKAIIYFLLFIVLNLAISLGVEYGLKLFSIQYGSMQVMKMLLCTGLNSALLVALFTGLKWCPVSRDYVRSRPWGTLFWAVLLALGMIIPLAWIEELIPDAMKKDFVGELLSQSLSSPEGYFVICMLAPLAEEVVFRGAVITALVEWGKKKFASSDIAAANMYKIEWVAIVVGAMLFAIVHMNPAQIPHALIVGVLLGWIYVRTGSLVPCFIIHWINNSAAYVMVKLFPSLPMDAGLLDYFHGNQMAMYQAVGSSLLIALPALYQLHKRMGVNS